MDGWIETAELLGSIQQISIVQVILATAPDAIGHLDPGKKLASKLVTLALQLTLRGLPVGFIEMLDVIGELAVLEYLLQPDEGSQRIHALRVEKRGDPTDRSRCFFLALEGFDFSDVIAD
ncbi:MAG: hypothetical protein EON56_03125, partial [Alphaproteobacteria bacterium]